MKSRDGSGEAEEPSALSLASVTVAPGPEPGLRRPGSAAVNEEHHVFMGRSLRRLAILALAALTACELNINLGSLSTADLASSGSGDAADASGATGATGSTGSTGSTGVGTDPTSGDFTTSTGLCPSVGETGDTMFPASCAEVLVGAPGAPDGAYTLYAANDPARPWEAWCLDMDSIPKEYLTLVMTGEYDNFSSYVPGIWPGSTVQTHYTRIRIDPYCFLVDISDQTFASSTGQLIHWYGSVLVTSMPYGTAMDCVAPNSMSGRANIDLRGTPFAVLGLPFVFEGYGVNGSSTPSFDGQVVELTGGGYCGDARPVFGVWEWAEPINGWGGFLLPLVYAQ